MKNIVVLGATGSIGQSAAKVACDIPSRMRIVGMSAHRNLAKLEELAGQFPEAALCITDESTPAPATLGRCRNVLRGEAGLIELATLPEADMVLIAIVGTGGLRPALAAIEAGKDIAIASKEILVMAGEIVMEAARRKGVNVLPVDSEHNAIFQCLEGRDPAQVRRLILTASGGPFRKSSAESLESVTPAQALKHPTWNMGSKITIDSATLMNKGLEVIEAHYLFGVPYDHITVVISPQSTVHSMARFADGAILAHLGAPDMRTPIGWALAYPERPVLPMVKRLDLFATELTFHKPDTETFRCLALAEEAGRKAAIVACDAEAAGCAPRTVAAPIVLNAANEIAVQEFLGGRIAFLAIPEIVEKCLTWLGDEPVESVEDVYACDDEARRFAREATGRTS